jgi:hypothetical protein
MNDFGIRVRLSFDVPVSPDSTGIIGFQAEPIPRADIMMMGSGKLKHFAVKVAIEFHFLAGYSFQEKKNDTRRRWMHDARRGQLIDHLSARIICGRAARLNDSKSADVHIAGKHRDPAILVISGEPAATALGDEARSATDL